MALEMTQEQFNALFLPYPQVRKGEAGEPTCPHCGNGLSPESLDSYNGATEAGTPFCDVEITCDVCHKVAWRGGSWYPGVSDLEELIYAAGDALEEVLAR